MIIEILRTEDLETNLQKQVTALYSQLNASISQLSLRKIMENNGTTRVVICRDAGILVGMAMLAKYKVVSGHKGMIEDVIVDGAYRGQGIGRRLMERLLDEARKDQLDEVLLFSGHHRIAAISLYLSLGFQLKESGLYTLKFD